MKYLKNNLSLFLLLCIIFLFPVRWYKTSISAVNDFKGITVMVHDYFRIAALYILVIMIQAVAGINVRGFSQWLRSLYC